VASDAARYHDASKHHFHRFARSLGYLDWATQPDPFRRYAGAAMVALPRPVPAPSTPYADLYGSGGESVPISLDTIGSFLRHAVGLSAWKRYGSARWSLRVNPSSGNLHPTETYVAWGDRMLHYVPSEHALEERCVAASSIGTDAFLVGLTSIHWREAWKYGERAFRYCQHDTGHAIAALRVAAALHGWQLALLPRWRHGEMAALLGTDRDGDYEGAEREEPECIAVVTASVTGSATSGGLGEWLARDPRSVVEPYRAGRWHGAANQLSPSHVDWPLIDEVAVATRFAGLDQGTRLTAQGPKPNSSPHPRTPAPPHPRTPAPPHLSAAQVILQRRSATAFDPRGVLRRDTFLDMLARLQPGAPPWDAIDWPPQIHLAMFIHRVQDIVPGMYAYVRDPAAIDALKAAMRPEFIWEPVAVGLYLLAPIDVRATANRLSCRQAIAEDGFFSLGMLARFEASLAERGDWFYRRLFWETGMIGQVLYLEAEAAGARSTGIGCFFDDAVHELLGLQGPAWQSLYHFSMGLPLTDSRLTTEPGYSWEAGG
jgi:nitroreductase